MSDLICRADAIDCCEDGLLFEEIIHRIEELPSADAESDDLIIKGAQGIQDGLYNIKDGKLFMYKANGGTVRTYPIVPSAEPTEDYSDLPDIPRAYYEKIVGNMSHEINMLKQQLESADAVHGEWTPCGEKMPNELERVNVTWLNHNPPFYYQHIKDIPQTDTAVYYRGKWYWWDATVIDFLAEYGEDCNAEQIDKDIEVVAWMPLPKSYECGARMENK